MDTIEKAPLTAFAAAELLPYDLDLTTPLKDLPLSSDFMFAEVMRIEKICTLFLESLLDKKIARIEYITKQADLKDDPVSHGIRLDVYLNDENQTRYDIEMQNVRKQNLERRARYYQSGIDRRFLQPGADYDDLPESYVIFVCNFDYFRRGLACYKRISSMEGCPGLVYEDGSHVFFLNSGYGEANVSPEIREFLDYLRTNDDTMSPRSELLRAVQEAVKIARNDPRLEVPYMTYQQKMKDLWKESYERGLSTGFDRGVESGIEKGHKIGREEGLKEGHKEGRKEGIELGITQEAERGIEGLVAEYRFLGQDQSKAAQALVRRYGLILPVAEDKVRKYWKK